MTMVDFAKRLRVSTSYISQIESGKDYKLGDVLLHVIETEFKVNLAWLMDDSQQPYKDVAPETEATLVRIIRGLSTSQQETLLLFLKEIQHVG